MAAEDAETWHTAITVWKLLDGIPKNDPVASFSLSDDPQHIPDLSQVVFSPNSAILVLFGSGRVSDSGDYSDFVWLWDAKAFKPLVLLKLNIPLPTLGGGLTFSPDGKLLIVARDAIYAFGVPGN